MEFKKLQMHPAVQWQRQSLSWPVEKKKKIQDWAFIYLLPFDWTHLIWCCTVWGALSWQTRNFVCSFRERKRKKEREKWEKRTVTPTFQISGNIKFDLEMSKDLGSNNEERRAKEWEAEITREKDNKYGYVWRVRMTALTVILLKLHDSDIYPNQALHKQSRNRWVTAELQTPLCELASLQHINYGHHLLSSCSFPFCSFSGAADKGYKHEHRPGLWDQLTTIGNSKYREMKQKHSWVEAFDFRNIHQTSYTLSSSFHAQTGGIFMSPDKVADWTEKRTACRIH